LSNALRFRLEDVPANPYADQLAQGFRRLAFAADLESEYRRYQLDHTFALRRLALLLCVLILLVQGALDLKVIAPPVLWWVLGVRGVVLVLLLACVGLVLQRRHQRLLGPLTLVCVLAIGIGSAVVVVLAQWVFPGYPSEGLLLICLGSYFLAGMRLPEAAGVSLSIVLVYAALELTIGTQNSLADQLLYLLFGNLIGAAGCYQLEYKSREQFLIRRLLRQLADRDSLTGLHNRRSFRRHLDTLWRQSQREGRPIAMLLGDIDYFKRYNDCYGHQAGDETLQEVALLFQMAARRPLDMAVRLGGEEFALLLYGSSAEDARECAEELCERLRSQAIEHAASPLGMVTISLGGVSVTGDDDPRRSVDELYVLADQALYRAKAAGRNRVVIAGDRAPGEAPVALDSHPFGHEA
jgi:diguanylate cyclase (GGDEF)-like protein